LTLEDLGFQGEEDLLNEVFHLESELWSELFIRHVVDISEFAFIRNGSEENGTVSVGEGEGQNVSDLVFSLELLIHLHLVLAQLHRSQSVLQILL
jgi:hypothetical protein